MSVTLVPTAGQTIDASQLQTYINQIYNPLGIQVTLSVDQTFTYTGTNPSFTGSGWFDTYTPEMKALNQAYQAHAGTGFKPNEAYVFVLPGSGPIAGDMPRGKQFGYLTGSLGAQVLAHELAHGVFHLKHTFDPDYGLAEGTLPQNLMDYRGGTLLNKPQWDGLHDPGLVLGVFERDEDAMGILANTALVRRILEKLRYCYVNSQQYSLTKEESGNNYCSNIKLSDGITYSSISVNNNHEQWSIAPNTCLVNSSNTIINYVPRDEAGITSSVKAGDFTVKIDDPKNANFISYMKPDAAKWQNQVNTLKSEIFNETDRDKCIELMYALPDELFTAINADYRKKYLKRLSEGSLDEGMLNRINEEKLAIRLISSTQSDQIESIINYLNTDRLMSDLCNGIDNIGGEDNFTTFTNILFKLYLQKYSTSLTTNYILPDDRVFQWMDKGLLDKLTYKVDYLSNNQIAFSWKYRQDYYTNPIKVAPFEIVAVNFVTDVNFITIPNDKRVILMPAFVFAWMVNEDNNVDAKLKTDITIKLAEFVFAYYQVKTITKATSTLVKTLRYINAARTGTNLILVSDAVRDEIENLAGGPSFIAAYEKINDVWEISDFTVNWFNGNIEHFTVFTQAWDKMVDSNRGIDVVAKYPEFYKLVNQIKEGLK